MDTTEGTYGWRVDYIKCSGLMYPEEALARKATWTAVFQPEAEVARGEHCIDVRSVSGDGTGRYTYLFQAWGPRALRAEQLDWNEWGNLVDRMDVRYELPVSALALDRLYEHLRGYNPTRRRIERYSSRPRNKRMGRDSGGESVAAGTSHSDWRVSVYYRVGEPGCIEFQCMGDRIRELVRKAKHLYKDGLPKWASSWWQLLAHYVWWDGEAEWKETTGWTWEEFWVFMDTAALPNERLEERISRVEAEIAGLPMEAVQALNVYIQERLI